MKENHEIQSTSELFQMIQQAPEHFAKGMQNGVDFNGPLTVPQYLEQLLGKYQIIYTTFQRCTQKVKKQQTEPLFWLGFAFVQSS